MPEVQVADDYPRRGSKGPARFAGFWHRLSSFPAPRTQRILLAVSIPVLVVAAMWSYWAVGVDPGELRVWPLVVVAVAGVPLTTLINAWEYRLSGRLLGQRIRMREALRIAILSTVLNYLPGHGGALLRVQGLRRGGAAYVRSAGATLAIGLVWISVSALAAGAWLSAGGTLGPGLLMVGLGVVTGGTAIFLVARERGLSRSSTRWLASVTCAEVASVVVLAARYLLILFAIGVAAPIAAGLLLALASVIAAASGLMPGGLGIREVLAALLGPLAGVAAAAAFLATAVDRVIGILVHAVLAAPLVFLESGESDDRDTDRSEDAR